MDLFDKKDMKNMPYIYKVINIWWQKYHSLILGVTMT